MSEAEKSAGSKFSRAGQVISTYPSVTTSAAKFLNRNANRREIIMINNGAADITVDTRQGLSAGVGIVIGPGASKVFLKEEDGDLVKDEWFVISAAGGETMTVKEVLDK